MYLTKNQEMLLAGEKGNAIAKIMNLIIKIGEVGTNFTEQEVLIVK